MSSFSEPIQPGTNRLAKHSGGNFPTIVPEMLLFDIDGVITEPITGEVELAVVDEIVAILERDEPVAFNTGRGWQWILRDILPDFTSRISKRSVMSKLCIVYQKGAFRITFDEKGEQEAPVAAPGIVLIPDFLRAEALQLVATKYRETMFPGEEKEAIFSPQFKLGANFEQYKADQERLVEDLRTILRRYDLADQFRVDPTRIATDIEDKRLGKALGAQQVLAWLQDQGVQPQYFIAFGDSKSDVAMAEEIHRQGFLVEFVFVGEKTQLEGSQLPFPVSLTQAFCEKGTIEYLSTFKQKTRNTIGETTCFLL